MRNSSISFLWAAVTLDFYLENISFPQQKTLFEGKLADVKGHIEKPPNFFTTFERFRKERQSTRKDWRGFRF